MYQITGLVNYDSTNGTHAAAQDETGSNTQPNMDLATNLQTVNMGEEATVTFMNEKTLTGSVRLKKTDTSGTILPGAVFQVFEQLGAAPDKANDRFLGEKTVGADGYITLTERAAGTYYFIETIAPTGYVLNNTIHTVTLTAADITAQNNSPADESLIPTVTVQNRISAGKVRIRKTVSENGHIINDGTNVYAEATDEAKTLLAGIYTFGIYTDETCETPFEAGGIPQVITLQVGSECAPAVSADTVIPTGVYWIKEQNLPNGVHSVPEKQRISVSNDNYDDPITVAFRNDVQTFKLPVPVTKTILNGRNFQLHTERERHNDQRTQYHRCRNSKLQ